MEKFNAKLSSDSIGKINSLVEKINWTCNALLSALELNSMSVGVYGISVTEKLDSEFVDRVVLNIMNLKNHLKDLKREVNVKVIKNAHDLKNIVSSLTQVVDNLTAVMNENGFFRKTFQMPIDEIKMMVENVMSEIEIGKFQKIRN